MIRNRRDRQLSRRRNKYRKHEIAGSAEPSDTIIYFRLRTLPILGRFLIMIFSLLIWLWPRWFIC